MIASNIDRTTLEDAAKEIGVALDIAQLSESGRRFRVKVNALAPDSCYRPPTEKRRARTVRYKDERGDAPYQRESDSYFNEARRVHAVCWHGFRDFFRACFRREPQARFYTAMDKWLGSEDFEARFPDSGHRNIGSQAAPVMAAEACRCPDAGYAG